MTPKQNVMPKQSEMTDRQAAWALLTIIGGIIVFWFVVIWLIVAAV